MAEPVDAKLEDIVRHGAGAPELNIICCEDMDPEVNRDSDDKTVWSIYCRSCDKTIAYVVDRAVKDRTDDEG